MFYKVVEVFQSIQGEGLHVGLPVNFIRLAGCPVNCDFCDTDKETKVTATVECILRSLNPVLDHVVLTGGEPAAQNLEPLCEALHRRGYKIHLETSGWGMVERELVDFISLSPKQGTIDFILSTVTSWHVDEVKWLVPLFDIEDILWAISDIHWLQPINAKTAIDKDNLKICLNLLQDTVPPVGKSLRLSVQLHKLIGIR